MKKLIFIFTVFILSMSCVCASNMTDDTAGHIDDLASDINLTGDGNIITLENDYQTNNASYKHIIIDDSITIDGNGHTIDASDIPRVFWVKADNVVIKNINFINGKTTGLAGGVISWWGNNGTLLNCNFTNNVASSGGGAVFWSGDDATIANCNFMNNTAVTSADIGLTCGEGYDPSKPHIMTVNSDGGALYLAGNNISVDRCNFENNNVELAGGAIKTSWGNNVRISNSKFKNNIASYGGGAIDLNGDNALIVNSTFIRNSPVDLFLNSRNSSLVSSTFENESCIDSWYEVNYTDVKFGFSKSFDDLSFLISITPEGGMLVLEDDFEYTNGTNRGILISKPITIDGNGHTLDAKELSRIFNITADNVTISNINFINGKAIAKYFSDDIGGGAIYWNGSNGIVKNCNFTRNGIRGVDEDPFDREETIVNEDGTITHIIRVRPMGSKITEGGAIVWNGTNGTVDGCIFKDNFVGYANSGGAIYWRGDSGRVLNSEFYNNEGWAGASICWQGNNGEILYSKFVNSGNIFGRDIMWFAQNGTIKYCIMLTQNNGNPLYCGGNITADYNFWGDILANTPVEKIENLKNWVVLNATYTKDFVKKGDEITVLCNVLLLDKNGNASDFSALNISGNLTATADRDGFVQLNFVDGNLAVMVVPKTKVVFGDLTKYYKQSKTFKVRVYGADGKLAKKKSVKFTIGKKTFLKKTDSKGYAAFKISQKPGKYSITVHYDGLKFKSKITVKTTLITKNLSKKVKKSAKFKVKVLNSKGKKIAKKLVKIKFKGKTYKIKTNKNGIATFKIPKNLKVGKYNIKTICNGLTNSNKIIVKK